MKKKIFCTLMSLIVTLLLVACGEQATSATPPTSPTTSTPSTESSAPAEPAQHVHEWQEATCTTPKTCATCGETEGEALGHDWQDATMVEPKTCARCGATEGEPLSEADVVAEVLANEDFYEDGAFVPKLYAESLGFKFYGDYGDETDFSITVEGVEYFVWHLAAKQMFTVAYTDGEKCYKITVADYDTNARGEVAKLKIADTVVENESKDYVSASAAAILRLYNGDTNIKAWQFGDLPRRYVQNDDKPQYFEDGFLDSTKLKTVNEEESDPYIEVGR